jgi:hypothetical protein
VEIRLPWLPEGRARDRVAIEEPQLPRSVECSLRWHRRLGRLDVVRAHDRNAARAGSRPNRDPLGRGTQIEIYASVGRHRRLCDPRAPSDRVGVEIRSCQEHVRWSPRREAIIEAIGCQIRGRAIEECFPEAAMPVLRERLARVLAGPGFMWNYGRVYVTSGRGGFGERLSLPLSEEGVRADGIFGATVYTFEGSQVLPRQRLERDVSDEEVEFFDL